MLLLGLHQVLQEQKRTKRIRTTTQPDFICILQHTLLICDAKRDWLCDNGRLQILCSRVLPSPQWPGIGHLQPLLGQESIFWSHMLRHTRFEHFFLHEYVPLFYCSKLTLPSVCVTLFVNLGRPPCT